MCIPSAARIVVVIGAIMSADVSGSDGVTPAAAERESAKATREAAATRALENLKQECNRGLTHASGPNAFVVVYSLAGLAFLASGSTTTTGPYAKELNKCADFVIAAHDHFLKPMFGQPGDQTTWALGHGAIFLAELYAKERSPKALDALEKYAREIESRQTEAGGWCHL